MSKKRYQRPVEGTGLFVRSLQFKNSTQQYYVNTMREMTVTFCSGPAGTSKTFLSSYVALEALLAGDIDKIILTRPLVATEDIGYLPGDMNEKIHPYVLPLLDAFEMHIGATRTKDLLADGHLEVLPLAYMRGRSLNRSFLILDEAQNSTKEQIKMFLTRLGYDSKIVINGDSSQSDLPKHLENGLDWAMHRLTGIDPSIGIVEFKDQHIVRHPLIGTMIKHLDSPAKREVPVKGLVALRRST